MFKSFEAPISTPTTGVENLLKLASYLESLPSNYPHFDMESYYHDPKITMLSEADEIKFSHRLSKPELGMCGCGLGHSAAAGIDLPDTDNWFDVARIVYGVDRETFSFLFGGEWYVEDNTPKGVAQRIRAYLA